MSLILKLRSDVLQVSAFLNTMFPSPVPSSLLNSVQLMSSLQNFFPPRVLFWLGVVKASFRGIQSSVSVSSVQEYFPPGDLKQQ